MDNLTHALTGALVADALPFTKRLGPKAPLVAAIASASPDLDMVPAFIANFPPSSLSFPGLFDFGLVRLLHRAYTHSFFYMALASIPLAYLAWRWSGKKGSWAQWFAMLIPAFFLHTVLDLTNPWGVRAWLPFSQARSAWGVLPLIDWFILAVAGLVFIVNHVLRDSYPDPDGPALPSPWRRRTGAALDAVAGPTTVGALGMALVVGRICQALAASPPAAWF